MCQDGSQDKNKLDSQGHIASIDPALRKRFPACHLNAIMRSSDLKLYKNFVNSWYTLCKHKNTQRTEEARPKIYTTEASKIASSISSLIKKFQFQFQFHSKSLVKHIYQDKTLAAKIFCIWDWHLPPQLKFAARLIATKIYANFQVTHFTDAGLKPDLKTSPIVRLDS